MQDFLPLLDVGGTLAGLVAVLWVIRENRVALQDVSSLCHEHNTAREERLIAVTSRLADALDRAMASQDQLMQELGRQRAAHETHHP